MTSHDPIVVGVNGSAGSSAAIRYAAHEAQRLGSSVQLAHVIPNLVPLTPMFPIAPTDLDSAAREILHEAAEEARPLVGTQHLTTVLLDGPRVPSLLRTADHARMVVVGHERRSTMEHLITGSTLTGLAARAVCPIVSVPEEWVPREEHGCIVVGIKSTEHSAGLVRRALEIAGERKARVVLVHAWALPQEYDDLISSRIEIEEWAERARRSIERSLSGLREAYAQVPIEVRVVHGQAARVLQHASEEADLLVLARRAHAFPFGHLGGTARALLRESACPVEIVPPADAPVDTGDLVLEQSGVLKR